MVRLNTIHCIHRFVAFARPALRRPSYPLRRYFLMHFASGGFFISVREFVFDTPCCLLCRAESQDGIWHTFSLGIGNFLSLLSSMGSVLPNVHHFWCITHALQLRLSLFAGRTFEQGCCFVSVTMPRWRSVSTVACTSYSAAVLSQSGSMLGECSNGFVARNLSRLQSPFVCRLRCGASWLSGPWTHRLRACRGLGQPLQSRTLETTQSNDLCPRGLVCTGVLSSDIRHW